MRNLLTAAGWLVGTLLAVVALYSSTGVNNQIEVPSQDRHWPNLGSTNMDVNIGVTVSNKGPAPAENVAAQIVVLGRDAKDQDCSLGAGSDGLPFLGAGHELDVTVRANAGLSLSAAHVVLYCVVRKGILPFEKFYTYGSASFGPVLMSGGVHDRLGPGMTFIEGRTFFPESICPALHLQRRNCSVDATDLKTIR